MEMVAHTFEFEASLVYKASPGQPGLLHRETLSQKNKKLGEHPTTSKSQIQVHRTPLEQPLG